MYFNFSAPLNRESRMVGSDRSSEDSQEGSGLDQLVFIKAPTNETQTGKLLYFTLNKD